MNQITINSIHCCVLALYNGEQVPNNMLNELIAECEDGFNAFNIERGAVTMELSAGGSIGQLRGYNRHLTPSEIHAIATDGMKTAPKFDPDNPIYFAKGLTCK